MVPKVPISVLRLDVLELGGEKKLHKVIKSSTVERLIVRGPCTLNLCPGILNTDRYQHSSLLSSIVMENLREVEVESTDWASSHIAVGENARRNCSLWCIK